MEVVVTYVMRFSVVLDVDETTPIETIEELADEKMHKESCYVSELDPVTEKVEIYSDDDTCKTINY